MSFLPGSDLLDLTSLQGPLANLVTASVRPLLWARRDDALVDPLSFLAIFAGQLSAPTRDRDRAVGKIEFVNSAMYIVL